MCYYQAELFQHCHIGQPFMYPRPTTCHQVCCYNYCLLLSLKVNVEEQLGLAWTITELRCQLSFIYSGNNSLVSITLLFFQQLCCIHLHPTFFFCFGRFVCKLGRCSSSYKVYLLQRSHELLLRFVHNQSASAEDAFNTVQRLRYKFYAFAILDGNPTTTSYPYWGGNLFHWHCSLGMYSIVSV